jgi:acyl-CoA thioesterase FadM
LRKTYQGVGKLFLEQKIAMPIVSTRANFLAPIFAGNLLEIHLDIEFGETSFTVKGALIHDGKEKGNVEIKHVCLEPHTMKRISSKDLFHGLLEF